MRTTVTACALVLLTAASARSESKMSDGDAEFAAALHARLRGHAGQPVLLAGERALMRMEESMASRDAGPGPYSAGSDTVKVVPLPTTLSTEMVPP